ncbi:MAG: hypothetical protein AAGK66_04170 [Pseudomonadota bacterium]
MKYFTLFILLASCATSAIPSSDLLDTDVAQSDLSNHYEMMVKFDPESGNLDASGIIEIVADTEVQQIDFLLNGNLDVERFETGILSEINIESGTSLDSYQLPKTQKVSIILQAPLNEGEAVTIGFAYAGQLTTDSIEIGRGGVDPAWTEMSMGALWYPLWLEELAMTASTQLEIPEQYDLTGSGDLKRIAPTVWQLEQSEPVIGRLTFFASNGWEVSTQALNEGTEMVLYSIKQEPGAVDIFSAVQGAYEDFEAIFGAPSRETGQIRLLNANDDIGLVFPAEAYATGGDFIVLDNASSPDARDNTLNHEIAHIWWFAGQPGTPDEFLSESIAEYMAMRRGAMVWGQEWLDEKRASVKAQADQLDVSILGIQGFSATRQPLLYKKGPHALWMLHDRIGEDDMNALLKETLVRDVETMSAFFALLEEQHGETVSRWFENQL